LIGAGERCGGMSNLPFRYLKRFRVDLFLRFCIVSPPTPVPVPVPAPQRSHQPQRTNLPTDSPVHPIPTLITILTAKCRPRLVCVGFKAVDVTSEATDAHNIPELTGFTLITSLTKLSSFTRLFIVALVMALHGPCRSPPVIRGHTPRMQRDGIAPRC
jgi:hypothetical protein